MRTAGAKTSPRPSCSTIAKGWPRRQGGSGPSWERKSCEAHPPRVAAVLDRPRPRLIPALHPTLQMSRTCLVDDSHAVALDRVAAALEIVRRPAGPPRPLPRGVPERNPRPHRPERRRQDDDAEDPRRVVAAGLRDRARARPRCPRRPGRLQGGARLHAGGPDPPRVPDADRVPRVRWPDPESPERADAARTSELLRALDLAP